MTKLGTLLLLAAVLAALVVINRALAGQHVVLSGAPGEALLASGFDEDTGLWSTYDDGRLSAVVSGGTLTLTVDQPESGAFSTAQPVLGDFDMRATAAAVDGPVDNGYGVILRLNDHDNLRPSDDDFLLFLISSDGYYRLTRVTAGSETIISDWVPSAAIRQGIGSANTIRVVATGDELRFSINDQPVSLCIPNDPGGISTYMMDTCIDGAMLDHLVDTGAQTGQVGAAAFATATGGPGVQVAFEQVVILQPEPGS